MWVKIDTGLPWHDKAVNLSSDGARWAYLKVLCLAKQHGRDVFSRGTMAELLGKHGRFLDDLVRAGVLDESDGKLVVHDFGEFQRRADHQERQSEYRRRQQSVTGDVTAVSPERHASVTGASAERRIEREREEREKEESRKSARATSNLPDEDDPLTIICQLLMTAAPIEDVDYRQKVDDQTRRYTAEWVIAAYRQAFEDFVGDGKSPRRWDLAKAADVHLAGWTRAEELRSEEARERADAEEARRVEEKARAMTPEEKERSGLVRQAVRLWLNNPTGTPVPEKVDDLRQWIAERSA